MRICLICWINTIILFVVSVLRALVEPFHSRLGPELFKQLFIFCWRELVAKITYDTEKEKKTQLNII